MVAVDIRRLGNRGGRFTTCRSGDRAGRIGSARSRPSGALGSLGQHVAAKFSISSMNARVCRLGAGERPRRVLPTVIAFTQIHRTRHRAFPLEVCNQTGDGVRLGIAGRVTPPQKLHGQFAQLVLHLFEGRRAARCSSIIMRALRQQGQGGGLHCGLAGKRRGQFRCAMNLLFRNTGLLDRLRFGCA